MLLPLRENPDRDKKKPSLKSPSNPHEADLVHAKFESKKADFTEKIESMFEQNISAQKIDERGLIELRRLKEAQKAELEKLFNKHREMFDASQGSGSKSRESLATELLEEAIRKGQVRLTAIEAIIKKHKEGRYITTEEAYEIEKSVLGIEDLLRKDIRIQQTVRKINDNIPLIREDYMYIASILNPYDITRQRQNLSSTFEAMSAGILVGLMTPEEREKLVEAYMESNKSKRSAELIDALISTGTLTLAQGKRLFKTAVEKKVLSPEQFAAIYQRRLEGNYYFNELEKFNKVLKNEQDRQFTGMCADNIMDRIVGPAGLGGLMALWGFVTTGLNMIANRHNPASWFSNPYSMIGITAVITGTEMATGTIKNGTDWIGDGAISSLLGGLLSSEDPEGDFRRRQAKIMIEKYENAPTQLQKFFDNGGYSTIQKVRQSKIEQHQKPMITLADLLAVETDPTQKAYLETLKENPAIRDNEYYTTTFSTLSEIGANLKIENGSQFMRIYREGKVALAKLAAVVRAKPKTPTIKKPDDTAV